MARRRTRERDSGDGSRWRWWVAAAALLALLWWWGERAGLSPAPQGQTHAPPLAEPDAEAPTTETVDTTSARASEPAPRRVLRGRCLDASTRAPLPGFSVRIQGGEGRVIEAPTGGDGRFELAWSGDGSASIEVAERAGWSEGLAARPLSPEELVGETEVLLLVSVIPRAVVRGRVLDARTGQGLANMTVRLGEGRERETLRTGEAGEFSSREARAAGAVVLEVVDESPEGSVDHGRHAIEHTGREDAQGLELSAAVGPTISLAPAGTGLGPGRPWRARILERRGDPRLSARILGTPGGWVLARLERTVEVRDWSWCSPRGAAAAWIRYARVEHEPSPEFLPALEVESLDGELRGEAALPATVGVLEQPVAVELREVGWLVGELLDAAGTPVPRARIWLDPGGGGVPLGPWSPTASGSFELPGLEPGAYELTITAPLRPAVSRALEVVPGENRVTGMVLPRAGSAHHLRGRFECRLDHAPGAVLLELEEEHGRDTRRKLLRRVSSGLPSDGVGESTNEFAFTNLAGGTYVLRPIAITGSHRWSPDQLTVTTPVAPLLVRCIADSSGTSLRLDTVDADSGQRVTGQELYLGPVQQPPFTQPEARPAELWYTLPRGSPLAWTVWAPGYQPATGYVGDTGGSGTARPTRVELKRGFGMRLVFRATAPDGTSAPDDAAVLSGVEVVIDGESHGESDEAGELLLQLERRPERIDLLHPRWRAVRLEDGARGQRLPLLRLWFEPR